MPLNDFGPGDGETSRLVSGDPPAVLVVDDSGGRYVRQDGRYWWSAASRSGPIQ